MDSTVDIPSIKPAVDSAIAPLGDSAVLQTPLIVWLFLVTNPDFLDQLKLAKKDNDGIFDVVFKDKEKGVISIPLLAKYLDTNAAAVQTPLDQFLGLPAATQACFFEVAEQFQSYINPLTADAYGPLTRTDGYDPMECGIAGITALIP